MTTPATDGDLTAEQRRMVARLERTAVRFDVQNRRMEAIKDERVKAYRAARSIKPPLTFTRIAAIFGITEAAVMQDLTRLRKREARQAS